jgi:hypothetical protein
MIAQMICDDPHDLPSLKLHAIQHALQHIEPDSYIQKQGLPVLKILSVFAVESIKQTVHYRRFTN